MIKAKIILIGTIVALLQSGCFWDQETILQHVTNDDFIVDVCMHARGATVSNYIGIEVRKSRLPDYPYYILGAESADSAWVNLDTNNILTVEIYGYQGYYFLDSTFVYDLNYVDTIRSSYYDIVESRLIRRH